MFDTLIKNSIQKTHKDTYYQELQNVINSQVLNHLFYLASYDTNYRQINAIVHAKLNEITMLLKNNKANGVQKMYHMELVNSIINFKKNPSKYKKQIAPNIPDGSPIGME